MAIADRMCDVLAGGAASTPAALLRLVAQETTDEAERRELRRLRLIGDPLTPLRSTRSDGGDPLGADVRRVPFLGAGRQPK
jgi:hypothetical protein